MTRTPPRRRRPNRPPNDPDDGPDDGPDGRSRLTTDDVELELESEVVLAVIGAAGLGFGVIGHERVGAAIVLLACVGALALMRARGELDAVGHRFGLDRLDSAGDVEGDSVVLEKACVMPECEGSVWAIRDGSVREKPACRACGARYDVEVSLARPERWTETKDGSGGTASSSTSSVEGSVTDAPESNPWVES